MLGSGKAADDVVADPPLEGPAVEDVGVGRDADRAPDLAHHRHRDAGGAVEGRVQPPVQLCQPTRDDAADPAGEHVGPVEQRHHRGQAAVVGDLELDVVDVAAQPAVAVDDLVVEQLPAAVELAVLNRNNSWVSWDLRGRDVFQTIWIPARPFVGQHLDELLDVFLEALSEVREDLALRLRAEEG